MKKHLQSSLFVLVMLGLCAPPVSPRLRQPSRASARIFRAIPSLTAMVEWVNQDNGQKYTLKTNKKGEYFSLGLTPGKYNVSFTNADDFKAGKELFHTTDFRSSLDENTLDFDLKKEQERAAQGQGLTPEQIKQKQEAAGESRQRENNTIKTLNEKIVAAKLQSKLETSIPPSHILTEATQMDATRDLIWAQARRCLSRVGAQADRSRREVKAPQESRSPTIRRRLRSAEDHRDATKRIPTTTRRLAAYYNNLAEAAAKAGQGRRCGEGLYPGGAS